VTGLRTRGDFTLDIEWENHALKKAILRSGTGGNCRIRTAGPVTIRKAIAKTASGENPNPLFRFIVPGNSAEKSVKVTQVGFEYYTVDFQTKKDRNYFIYQKQ